MRKAEQFMREVMPSLAALARDRDLSVVLIVFDSTHPEGIDASFGQTPKDSDTTVSALALLSLAMDEGVLPHEDRSVQ